MVLGVRQRILLTLLSVMLVVAAVVGAGLNLMERIEENAPAAVGEKTDRVLAIEAIGSDFNRIDASFRIALNGSFRAAREQHEQIWRELNKKLADAEHNADPEERELFTQITRLADDYRRQGDAFYAQSESASARSNLYYGPHGLLATLEQLKKVLTECFRFEQASMTTSINNAHVLVVGSLLSFEVMLVVTILLAGLAAGYRIRAILRPNRSAAYDEKDAGPAVEPDFSGPICLCSVSVWLAVVFAWNSFPSRPISSSAAALHTETGAAIYHPEYDIPIYLAGLAVAVLTAVAWALAWHRCWQAASTDRRRRDVARPLKIHKWFAIGSVAVASVFPNGRLLNVYSAALAALAAVILWYEARRTGNGSAHPTAGTHAQRRASSTGSHARHGGRAHRSPQAQLATLSGSSHVADAIDSDRAHRSQVGRWWAMAAIGIVTLLVYIPNPTTLARVGWTEHFRHWNYYFVGPFLNFQHGAAFGSQCYTQYGVGWPLLISAISKIQPISYEWLLESASVYGCIYFVLLFFFLRSLTGRTAWAFVGLFLSLFLQMFCGTDWPIWVAPSSTILRAPLDVIVYWSALKHARSGDSRWGLLIGGAAGLGLLFGSDTGIYVIAAVIFYGLLCWGYRPGGKRLLNIPFARNTGVAMLATFLGGLSWASRGTCFHPEFWPAYWESILLYSGGMSSLPMSLGIERPQEFVLLMTVLTTYSFAIAIALFRLITRKLEATDLVLALVAASGLGMLILFINRSHPFNIYHPIIPFCILASHYCSRWTALPSSATSASGATRMPSWRRNDAVPIAIVVVLLVALASNRQVRTYPSLLTSLLPSLGSELVVTPRAFATGDAGRTASVGYREEMRPLVEALQRLTDGGRHSVAVVAQGETALLFLADVAPYFRYSPLELVDWRQVASVERTIIDHPPDFVLFCNSWPTEMRRRWEKFLGERYHKESQVQDGWFVLRRIPPPS